MMANNHPIVMLIGAGHVNLYLAARAERLVERGARVILLDPGKFWYSGMATGVLGGMYEPAEDQIDPKRLIESHGGEYIEDRVVAVEPGERIVRLEGGDELSYDYLSVNVGSRVDLDTIPGMSGDPSVWTVKPIANLWRLREKLEKQLTHGDLPRIAVIGGGPTGCEVAANLLALAARHQVELPVSLITSRDRLIPESPYGASRSLLENLTRRGLTVRTASRVERREGRQLIIAGSDAVEAELVVLATGLVANRLIANLGLAHDVRAGLRIAEQLHAVEDERVFAGGDCASMVGYDLPKLGVFGVRQAAIIFQNICSRLEEKPLQPYKPQQRYLAILNLGDGTGLATWSRFWWQGRASLWLKNWIDQKFLQKYRSDQ